MSTQILPQNNTACNSPRTAPTLAHNQIFAAVHLISHSGAIIPAGSPGRLIGYTEAGLIIDFGLLPVFCLPADSPLIAWGVNQ